MARGVENALAKVLAATAHLPGIEQSTSYGSLSVKVQGKYLCSIKDPDTLSLRCAMEDKEMLFEAAPEIYYETDHYKGWPGLLVRLNKISKKELAVRLERAWRIQAPKKLQKAYDSPAKPGPKKK
ncbi:MAG: MmcQ/YjbR family DNA-binding protein [Rhodospirillaceae bacterium]|nr:MmcQ/YjbR family DNA-binding protein [Rhodospirillaceae bacterium]